MNTMNYKGYAARIEFDERDDIFAGHIAGIHDIVGFHADTVKELHAAGAARGARRSVITSCGARRQKSQSMGSKKKIIKEATQA